MIAQHGTLLLSASRLRHNIALYRNRLASAAICATIKADAYGHGLRQVLPLLQAAGVEWCCVYSIPEALEIAALTGRILPHPLKILTLAPLVLTPESSADTDLLAQLVAPVAGRSSVRITLTDLHSALLLAETLKAIGAARSLPVHVQIDTGLTRAGIAALDAPGVIAAIEARAELSLEGIYSHFSHGDEPGHITIVQQIDRLWSIAGPAKVRRPELLVHVQNSGGAWHVSSQKDSTATSQPSELATFSLARVGIGLYGLQPSTADPIPGLRPIARLVAPILSIHERPAGVGVGYGHTFTTMRPSRLAIVPVGYADGYPRALSNRGVVQVRACDCGNQQQNLTTEMPPAGGGGEAPVVGRVSMDQIVVDVTDLPWARIGHEVTVISDDPAAPNSLDRIADALGTIGYELATHLGTRLQREVAP